MPGNFPLERSVLSDRIKDHLLQEIMTGHYPPGARIVETRVARELGTSQAPVREALRDLEALGIVEINAFKGARVRHPNRSELSEAYDVRAELESLGARLALTRMTDADLDELEEYLNDMQAAADAGDTHRAAVIDVAFHGRIVEIAGNRTLERVWRYLEPMSRTYITLVVPGVNARQVADLHIPILTALRCRDPQLAVEAYHQHFQAASDMFGLRWVDDEPEPVTDDGSPPDAEPQPRAAASEPGRRIVALRHGEPVTEPG